MSNILELLYDYCRICLENTGGKNIFSDAALLGVLETCTGVLYPNTAGLSQLICDTCEGKLKTANEFRNLAIVNQNKLQSLQGEPGDQEVEENDVQTCLSNLDNYEVEKIIVTPSISVRTDIFKRKKLHEDPGEILSKQCKKLPFIDASDHKCETCNKIFSSKKSLNLHLRIHSEERSHPCPVCSKVFPTSSDYRKHALIHTGIKPFECDICHKAFTQKVTLKKHKETIHSFQPYELVETEFDSQEIGKCS